MIARTTRQTPHAMAQSPSATQKPHQNLIFASVPLLPKFASEVSRGFANFGIGTLAETNAGTQRYIDVAALSYSPLGVAPRESLGP
jgi:hypothetical protein